MGFISYCMSLSLYIMSSCLMCYSILMNLILQMHDGQQSMCGVIVVESFRSTCFGSDAYIHDHRLDILITMLNSINCSTVICLPTVILMLLREATSETYGPRVYLHHINLPTLIYFLCFLLCFYFTLHLIIKIPKILSYHIYQISLS